MPQLHSMNTVFDSINPFSSVVSIETCDLIKATALVVIHTNKLQRTKERKFHEINSIQ